MTHGKAHRRSRTTALTGRDKWSPAPDEPLAASEDRIVTDDWARNGGFRMSGE